jgi:hypothetical protein
MSKCQVCLLPIVVSLALGTELLGQSECGTVLQPEEAALAWALQQAGAYELPGAAAGLVTAGDIPLTLHVVRETDGSGGIAQAQLDNAVSDANAAFEAAGISFCVPGSIDYIDSDEFYFNIDTSAEIDALRSTNPVPNTINIYFTLNLARESGGICGTSSFTFSRRRVCGRL